MKIKYLLIMFLITGLLPSPSASASPPPNRQKQIAIKAVDQDGSPLAGASITYNQTSLDFLFGTEWAWWYSDFPQMQNKARVVKMLDELGMNTWCLYLYHEWAGVEPLEGEFHWSRFDHLFETRGSGRDDVNLTHMTHVQVRAGPPFGDLNVAPDWVDTRNLTRFRRQYGDYLERFAERYRGRVDLHLVFGELEGALPHRTLDETLEWARWETSIIRRSDPGAEIMIQTGDMRYFMREMPRETWTFNGVTHLPEWMILEALIDGGVDFDGVAVESHHGTKDPGDWHLLKERIENLTAYGKDVFVWEIWYPSAYDPNVYFDWRPSEELPQQPPYRWPHSADTYTVEWQRDQTLNTMKMLVENPRVIGVSWFVFIDGHLDWGNASSGLVDKNLAPKPSYLSLRDHWRSLFTRGKTAADPRGEATFQGMPGAYTISVDAEGHVANTTRIRVQDGANTYVVSLQTAERPETEGYRRHYPAAAALISGVALVVLLWRMRK